MNERIKEIRASAGLTQAQFAERLNLSRNYVAMIEIGQREPGDRTIADICRVFGIREEWLRDGLEPMRAPKTREEEISELVGKALNGDNEFKKAVIRMICSRTDDDLKALNKALRDIYENL